MFHKKWESLCLKNFLWTNDTFYEFPIYLRLDLKFKLLVDNFVQMELMHAALNKYS